jgi:hypothetical protein
MQHYCIWTFFVTFETLLHLGNILKIQNKKMKKNLFSLTKLLSLSILIFISSCKKDSDLDPEEENEIITTIKLNFTAGGSTKTFTYSDTDGDGGNAPTKFETITLAPNTSYSLTIELLDESKTPVSNITEEVSEESDEHLFIFTPSPSNLLTYTYGDKDGRNFGVGLSGTAKTGNAGIGKLKVQLRHQPPIGGKPVKDGTSTPGSDDVNLDFNLIVQ